MAKQEWKWVRVKALSDNDKADIATACERFIAETRGSRSIARAHRRLAWRGRASHLCGIAEDALRSQAQFHEALRVNPCGAPR
jgi:hypothetical protein